MSKTFTDREIDQMRLGIQMMENVGRIQLELHSELATFGFHDGVFSFWTAILSPTKRVIYRVRRGSHPNTRANQKGIHPRQSIRPSRDWEIRCWLNDHPSFPILAFVGV